MKTSGIPQKKRMAMGEKVTGMKSGGYVKGARETARGHSDEEMDKSLVRKMVKKGALKRD